MAVHNVPVTYPDGEAPRIVAALKTHYGQIEDPPASGTFRDRTNAEALAAFNASVKDSLRHIVRNAEKAAAKAAAEAGVVDATIT